MLGNQTSEKTHNYHPNLKIYDQLIMIGAEFYNRGWVYGTSGNFSAVVGSNPLRVAITASGVDKGRLSYSEIIEVDQNSNNLRGLLRPSSETQLHLTIVRIASAGAVFHTHSVWGTVLSKKFWSQGGIKLSDFEMLKGLENVSTHEHEEWLPIIDNSQRMDLVSERVSELLQSGKKLHGLLLRGHGLYTWGKTIEEAKRHAEVIEFLLEVVGRTLQIENEV